jgi:hypothetical protein
MKHRHVGWLWWLLMLIAVEGMVQDARRAMAHGGELSPLPPDPADWVCQDSSTVVSQAATDAWCSTNVDRGVPAPPTLQIPPPLANLLAKDIFDVAFQSFLRGRVYDIVLGWKHDLN